MDQYYIAVKMDIVQSRKYAERNELQDRFIWVTEEEANRKFADCICSRFIVTHGDELQGLLKVDERVVDVINFFLDEMEPIQIRIGLGVGKLSTGLRPMAVGMDGQAFYLAKQAIDLAHDKRRQVMVQLGSPIETRVMNAILHLMFALREGWSDVQKEIVRWSRTGMTQKDVARRMGISQPAVSKHLKRAQWKAYHEAEETLRVMFAQIAGSGE